MHGDQDNVFLSIVESNSVDASAELLSRFDRELEVMGIPRRILVGDTSIIRPESMETTPVRIRYLAALRNLALEPLAQSGGYDKIVFTNDVFVEAESILELLKTRDGKWDMVCGLDLSFWGYK